MAPAAHGATQDTAAKRARLAQDGGAGQPFGNGAAPDGQSAAHVLGRPADRDSLAQAVRNAVSNPAARSHVAATSDGTTRLVVLTKDAQPLSAVATAARNAGATVKQTIPQLHAFSVTVPAGEAAALTRLLEARPDVEQVTVAHRFTLDQVPNDPRWSAESTYLNAVHAPTAWDETHGASSVKIAVVDTGVDTTHPDLARKIVGTYNAVSNSSTESDAVGHGTGVASIAAAVTDNGIGVAGAGWDTSLLAVKVADPNGHLWGDAIAQGVTWATNHGANVINMSLGSPQYDKVLADAVTYAQNHGVLVVASAGNDGDTAVQYPANLPGVVSVGATNQAGNTRTSWSTYGSWVDVAAPGASITYAQPGNKYTVGDGTSFSSPLVAGESALLKAVHPAATQSQLASTIIGNASTTTTLGFGHGLVNFRAAVDSLVPTTVPTVTEPASGETVSGDVPVTVQTSAAKVRVSIAGTSVSKLVTPSTGVAKTTLETYGLSGPHTLVAVDCTDGGVCAANGVDVPVIVDNAAPALTSPADGATVGVSFTAAATAPGGSVKFLLDGRSVGIDSTAPYQLTVSTDAVSNGPHQVAAVPCNRAGTICDAASASPSSAIDVERLHPSITSVSPAPFSPNGDTRRDTTTASYRLDVASKVVMSVENSSGATVVGPRALGTFGAGSHGWLWAGNSNQGNVVPDGVYTVVLTTSGSSDGTVLSGHAQRTVRVDRTRPRVSGVYHSPGTIYPYLDGFQDSTKLHLTLSEGVPSLQVQIFNRYGTPVRTINAGGRRPGATSVGWNGRRSTGAMVPAGTYYYRFVAQDAAGNRTTTAKYSVAVSAKRLVKHTASKTLTPYGSYKAAYVSQCSALARNVHGWSNSVGYFSDYYNCTDGDDIAALDHAYTLPSAVRYGTVRIDAYGTQAVAGYGDSLALIYYNKAGELSSTHKVLGPGMATYYGPTVPASNFLQGHTLRWLAGTVDGAWYDVKWYRVVWTYYVLQ